MTYTKEEFGNIANNAVPILFNRLNNEEYYACIIKQNNNLIIVFEDGIFYDIPNNKCDTNLINEIRNSTIDEERITYTELRDNYESFINIVSAKNRKVKLKRLLEDAYI